MNEMALKHLRDADSFSEMSVALHLVAEGNVLTMFRFSEYLSPTDVDKKIFRLVMQDEARHVGYGMQHFKYVLEHFPEKREVLHAHLDEAENISFAGAAATEVTESFIILAGGGMKKEQHRRGHQGHDPVQLEADARALRAAGKMRHARAQGSPIARSSTRCSWRARPKPKSTGLHSKWPSTHTRITPRTRKSSKR